MREEDNWVHGGDLEKMEFPHPNGGTYKPSTVSRQMRILTEDGRMEKDINQRGHVVYKYKSSVYESFHKQNQLL